MSDSPKVCVVMPAFNEADGIAGVIAAVETILEKSQLEHVICVVDDGSQDGTWQVLTEMQKQIPRVLKARRLSKNFGKDAAILAGLASVGADCYIVMDGDGQHPPEMVATFIEEWRRGHFDVVNGIKRGTGGRLPGWSRVGKAFNVVFKLLSNVDMTNASDFKLLSRRAVDAILECGDYNFFFRGMTQWVGFRHTQLPFLVEERRRGASKWSFVRLLAYAANAIVLYSYVPLYVLLLMGVVGLFGSGIIGSKLLVQYFRGQVPEGYSTLLAISLISLSMTLIAMGILGLYMQNVLDQVKKRPRYVVMDELRTPEGE